MGMVFADMVSPAGVRPSWARLEAYRRRHLFPVMHNPSLVGAIAAVGRCPCCLVEDDGARPAWLSMRQWRSAPMRDR